MIFRLSLVAAIVASVTGCTGKEPYVDRPYSINRELSEFPDGPAITVDTDVTVCYAKSGTTPAQIRALADGECARANLNAEFTEQSYSNCPLLTPVAAVFRCVAPDGGNRAGTASAGGAGAAATGTPAAAFEAPRPAGLGRSFGTLNAGDVSTTAKSQPYPTYLFNDGRQSR